MGRRNGRSLVKQVEDTFNNMKRLGESRHEEKQKLRDEGAENPGHTKGIFSICTLKNYTKHACQFVRWVRDTYECKTLDTARQHVPEYLQSRINLSPWTVHLDCAALSKLYGCKMSDWGVILPERKRADIVRSRKEVARDAHYNPENYPDQEAFFHATGVRRCEAAKVGPADINSDGSVVHIKGKGGKERDIDVLPPEREIIRAIADKAISEGRNKLFAKISENVDIHARRRDFAQRRYQYYVDNGMIDYRGKKNPIYYCRKDKNTTWYYRGAMLRVSHQMGHEREDVIASSYL